jgi:hypothetical protein
VAAVAAGEDAVILGLPEGARGESPRARRRWHGGFADSRPRIVAPGAAEQIINRMAPNVRVAPPLPSSTRGPIPATLTGNWRGELLAHNGAHPFRLSIEASGQLTGQFGDQPRTSISGVEWIDGELRGSLVADLGTDDVRKPYRLRFGLTPRSDRLEGAISAWAFRSGRGPDILPSFLSLVREEGSPSNEPAESRRPVRERRARRRYSGWRSCCSWLP